MLPLILLACSCSLIVLLVWLALSGPSAARAQTRRLGAVRERHGSAPIATAERLLRITATRQTRVDLAFTKLLPNREQLQKRLNMTGKGWTVGRYAGVSAAMVAVLTLLLLFRGLPLMLALMVGLVIGLGLPHFWVGKVIKRRIGKFTTRFPDAIDLLVRGLRSGLPISETMGVVGAEVAGPVGEEFRAVADKMKIGRSMDAALQDTADRLGTPEFQFFVITIAIQRETGGNLAETLANLADVLRKRSQMKLKIRAMSSESKASAYIVGSLPFIVFALIWFINASYMQNFFIDQRLMIAGMGGMVWMAIGAFIMAKMVNFEI